jgi:hypothetical protein
MSNAFALGGIRKVGQQPQGPPEPWTRANPPASIKLKPGEMPRQLQEGLERRRWMLARAKHQGGGRAAAEHGPKQRTLIEDMDKGRINIRAVHFPLNGQIIDRNASLRFPFITTIIATPFNVEMKLCNGYRQVFAIKEAKPGGWLLYPKYVKPGRWYHPRRYWVCSCGKSVEDLYERGGRLGCRHCIDMQYASQCVDKEGRKALRGFRVREFLSRGHGLSHRTKARLQASVKPSRALRRSKRISAKCLEARTSYSVHTAVRALHLP